MDGSTRSRYRRFFATIKNKNVEEVRTLINQSGGYVDSTAVNEAAQIENIEILKLLVETGKFDLNFEDNHGWTALQHALEKENFDIAKVLIDAGANVNTKTISGGETALHLAIKDNNESFAEYLLTRGANVNAQDKTGKTSLHTLALNNNVKIVKLLLDYKAEVNIQDNSGETPLFYAVKNVEMVQLLFDHGSDVNIKNFRGENALFNAIIGQSFEVVQMLLDQGSSVNCVNHFESTPLLLAAKYSDDLSIFKCLLKNGADAGAIDYRERSPFLILLCGLSWDRYFEEKKMNFILKYSNFDTIVINENNYLWYTVKKTNFWKIILQHTAKLQMLSLPINESVFNFTSKRKELSTHFLKCLEELTEAKNTKIKNCWVTLFNLLVDNKRKLKNYAGNSGLIKEFKSSDCIKNFPIYGSTMQENMEKGIQSRKLFDRSAGILSNNWPIFGPSHLIIRDLLDCLSTKDLSKFSE